MLGGGPGFPCLQPEAQPHCHQAFSEWGHQKEVGGQGLSWQELRAAGSLGRGQRLAAAESESKP